MKKLICALIGAAALVASATTYIQTSSTGTAPWRPVKDSVSQAHLADSALHAPPSAYADSSRVSGLADSAKRAGWARQADTARAAWKADSARTAWFAHAATYADSSRASGFADSAKRAGWAPLDTGRVRGIVSDTATALRTGIASASTTGNAATATKLATARTIATSGDVTGTPTNFDGTANITIPTTLPTLLTAGSAGSATSVPALTWDAKGRLTAVGSATISIPHTQISDWGSYINQSLLTTSSPTFNGATINGSIELIGNTYLRKDGFALNSDGTGWVNWLANNSGSPIITALGGFVGNLTGNSATATKLATPRTISATNDGTWSVSFDGSANVSSALTLASIITAGSAGSATSVPTITWDAKGRLTAVGSAAISIPHAQISDWGTYINQPLLTTSSPTFNNLSITGNTVITGTTDLTGGLYLRQDAFALNSAGSGWVQWYDRNGGSPIITAAGGFVGNLTGTASNASSLGGVAAANYGTLTQDTLIAKKVVSDSLAANTRAWTTLTAAKSSIHDTATALRAYIGSASTTGNAATSTKLATARTISMTGDGTWSTSFDGSANATGALTLATLLTAGSAGSATTVPTLTWDAKGRLTAVGSAAISIPHTQISDWATATSSFLTANQPISLTGAVTGSGTTSIPTSFANTHLAGINQDLATTSGPTFAAIVASNSYYGVVGQTSADAQKWYLVATVDITAQYSFASAVIRFNSVGNNGASGLGWQWAGSCFIRAKQQSAMSNGLDNFTIGWNYCHGFNPSGAVIGVKTTDNASHKIVNIYLLCPISYEGMSWQIDNLTGSITASGVGTNYVTTLPTGLATYTGASAIWSDWTNITVPGASTFTGLITANGGISGNLTGHASLDLPLTGGGISGDIDLTGGLYLRSDASVLNATSNGWNTWLSRNNGSPIITATGGFVGNLTGHASLDIPLTGSSAITGSLDPIGSTYSVGSSNAPWGEIHARAIAAHTVFYGDRLESTGNTLSLVGGTSVAINVGNNNLLNISYSSTAIYNPVVLSNTLTASGLITANGGISGNLTGHASLDIPLTGSSAITGSLVPQDANYYNLGTPAKPWYSISASTAYVDHLALAGPLSVKYAIYSTNVARTLDPSYLTMFVYTVSQTTTQTLQDGTISGETITVKNAQNSSTLVLTGNINAGSSTITSLSTAVLVWNGSTWY